MLLFLPSAKAASAVLSATVIVMDFNRGVSLVSSNALPITVKSAGRSGVYSVGDVLVPTGEQTTEHSSDNGQKNHRNRCGDESVRQPGLANGLPRHDATSFAYGELFDPGSEEVTSWAV